MMNSDFKRTDRIAELIQHKLANIVQHQLRDPRLPSLISISHVKISPDLSHAKIYFTVLNEDDAKTTASILNTAAGFLRASLTKSIQLRVAPQLHFVHDKSIAYSRHLNELIDRANPLGSHQEDNAQENNTEGDIDSSQ